MDLVRIPRYFYDDHRDRELPCPAVHRATAHHYWIDRDAPEVADLVSDARYYAADSQGFDPEIARTVCRSARNLLRALEPRS